MSDLGLQGRGFTITKEYVVKPEYEDPVLVVERYELLTVKKQEAYAALFISSTDCNFLWEKEDE